MTAIHLRVALACFVIGVGLTVLFSNLYEEPAEIPAAMIDDRTVSRTGVLTVNWTPTAKNCKVDVLHTNGKIRTVDFCNYRFPGFYDKQIVLRDGRQEITRQYGGTIYTLQDVTLVDLTGDGRTEALVSIEDFSGAGSSGVSNYYYVYAIRSGRLRLLWRVTTGSEGLAGLKNFKSERGNLVFEVFGDSTLVGCEIMGGGRGGECCPEEFSRITVRWMGGRFRQINVKVLPLGADERR